MADGASISRLSQAIVAESTRGTTPTTPGYTYLPIRRGSFGQVTKQFERSTLIRSDRQGGQQIGGVAGNDARLSLPLVRETGFLTLMESALSSAAATIDEASLTLTLAASGDTITRSAGSFTTAVIADRFSVGDLIYITGLATNQSAIDMAGNLSSSATTIVLDSTTAFDASGAVRIESEIITYTAKTATDLTGCTRGAGETTAATHLDNTVVRPVRKITAITATVITCGGNSLVDEGPTGSCTITALTKLLKPGTTRAFFTLEQHAGDIDIYEIFKGIETNTVAFTMPTSGEIGAEFGMLGTKYGTGLVSGSTYTSTLGNTPAAASANGSSLLLDGSAFSSCIESLNFNINNNRALKYGVGEQFACYVEEGDFDVETTFAVYWADATMQTKFQAETRFALSALAVDQNGGHRFRFNFPRLVLTSAPKGESGQSITEQLNAFAEYDTTTGTKFYLHWILGIAAVL